MPHPANDQNEGTYRIPYLKVGDTNHVETHNMLRAAVASLDSRVRHIERYFGVPSHVDGSHDEDPRQNPELPDQPPWQRNPELPEQPRGR